MDGTTKAAQNASTATGSEQFIGSSSVAAASRPATMLSHQTGFASVMAGIEADTSDVGGEQFTSKTKTPMVSEQDAKKQKTAREAEMENLVKEATRAAQSSTEAIAALPQLIAAALAQHMQQFMQQHQLSQTRPVSENPLPVCVVPATPNEKELAPSDKKLEGEILKHVDKVSKSLEMNIGKISRSTAVLEGLSKKLEVFGKKDCDDPADALPLRYPHGVAEFRAPTQIKELHNPLEQCVSAQKVFTVNLDEGISRYEASKRVHHAALRFSLLAHAEAIEEHLGILRPLVSREAFMKAVNEFKSEDADKLGLDDPVRKPTDMPAMKGRAETKYAKIIDSARAKAADEKKKQKEQADKAQADKDRVAKASNAHRACLLDEVVTKAVRSTLQVEGIIAQPDVDVEEGDPLQTDAPARPEEPVSAALEYVNACHPNGVSPECARGDQATAAAPATKTKGTAKPRAKRQPKAKASPGKPPKQIKAQQQVQTDSLKQQQQQQQQLQQQESGQAKLSAKGGPSDASSLSRKGKSKGKGWDAMMWYGKAKGKGVGAGPWPQLWQSIWPNTWAPKGGKAKGGKMKGSTNSNGGKAGRGGEQHGKGK